ncbi:MAG: S-adenosyl-l-methionine hydroxide adenosyltransferase family protein [Planctomycetota bacterium]
MSARSSAPLVIVLLAALGCSSGPEGANGGLVGPGGEPVDRGPPAVVLLTDFGLADDAVGLMRGVIHTRAPRSQILDLCHQVPRFDVRAGSRLLADAPGYYPPGTVFVVVVDPGVGTARRAVVARLPNGTLIVAPDNGVLSEALRRHGPAVVREVLNRDLLLPARSATFHGRDVFAPVGGSLAAGAAFDKVGPVRGDFVLLEPSQGHVEGQALVGEIEAIDEPFGNVWTNLPEEMLARIGADRGDRLRVTIGDKPPLSLPLAATFGEVPRGEPLAYPNSRGRVALALNMADFARTHGVQAGASIRIERDRSASPRKP